MSAIEWTDTTWNPVRGCSRVSEGCRNCYAERMAARFAKAGEPFHGFAKVTAPRDSLDRVGGRRNGWTGRVELVPSKLDEPLRWRKPRRVFVNSMSDLFHEALPGDAIEMVFAVMAAAPRHTFQILTKRAERLREWVAARAISRPSGWSWPLPNVWLGVSVEDQKTADERIPLLLQAPAAKRFVSYEPALGSVDLMRWVRGSGGCDDFDAEKGCRGHRKQRLDWVIVGGESGPRARPCDVAWVRSIVRQCREAGVAYFVKQLGANVIDRNDAGWDGGPGEWPPEIAAGCEIEHDLDGTRDGYQGAPVRVHLKSPKGGDPAEWPEDLRVREFPQ